MHTGALHVGPNYETAGNFADEEERSRRRVETARIERLEVFGQTLAKQRDEWINARRSSGWDKRVQEDIDQYHARDSAANAAANMMSSVEQGYPVTQNHAKATRSTVFIGLTRQKSNAAEARLSDILLPTDENNFSFFPTPVPELAVMRDDLSPAVDPQTGGELTLDVPDAQGGVVPTVVKKSDVALATETAARKAAKEMEKEVSDQLVECDYKAETRKMLHDAAVMGVGVMKGPVVMNRTRRAWTQVSGGVYKLEIIEEKKPASYQVDPRLVWEDPDCGDDVQKGKGVYELEQMTPKTLRALAKQPNYIAENISAVLEEGPKRSNALVELTQELQRDSYVKSTFDVWTYTGEIDSDDLRAAGVDVEEDELNSVSGVVVFVNSTVIKAYLNPIETGELPYDFYPWEKVTDSPRGYSVPYLMRSPQRVINAAWRMMLDNAAVCAGPQIIVKKGKLIPEDGTYALYARKVWLFNGAEDESAADAFSAVEFGMHQAELSNIINLGVQLADAETSTPMITQGEQGAAPETVGGMQMLLNSANVVLRRLVKQFDDYITKPHLRRYYDYNMAYNPKKEIKGDFSVDARGSSALLVRDIQNQAFMNMLAAGANPVYAKFIDPKKLFERALQAQHVQPQEIMKDETRIKADEEAQQGAQPQDPRVMAATISAESRVKEAEARAASDVSEIELRRAISEQNHAAHIAKLELEREIALLKYASDQKVTLDRAKASLAIAGMNNRQKAEQLQTEAQLRVRTGQGI